jgi:hypothetical protein
VLTLGTGTGSNVSWRGNNLLASHSYAVIGESSSVVMQISLYKRWGVLDVTEEDAMRTFAVLDTWINQDHENQSREASSKQPTLHIFFNNE